MDRKPIKNNNYKTVILGDSSVMQIFHWDEIHHWNLTLFRSQLSEQLFEGSLDLEDNYTFEIWDTAGQERYHCLTNVLSWNSFAIVVYDITSYDSFKNAKLWIMKF